MARFDAQVAIVGGGVVGCAVAHALARTGVQALLLEAQPGLAQGASGGNSGILHTGFDSIPGGLETQMILRAAELREGLLGELAVPFQRCGARLRAEGPEQRAALLELSERAARNGVQTHTLATGGAGADELEVPGEAITDPGAFTRALAAAAQAGGAEVRTASPVCGLAAEGDGVRVELAGGERVLAAAAVNCAGLQADEIAAMAGEEPFEIYPRKGEFLVFEQPAGAELAEILLPVPSSAGKGVLVFPTVDGHVIAGPTARDREDKHDRSVEPDAAELILARARRMLPALAGAEPIASYAGLRPAGRGVNYVIGPSRSLPRLVHAAAIRSTGLSAAPAIGERVALMACEAAGIRPGAPRALAPAPAPGAPAWWRLAAEHEPGGPERA